MGDPLLQLTLDLGNKQLAAAVDVILSVEKREAFCVALGLQGLTCF